jgi:1-acyl-sn-glycerol-3-phosphate acyltransferase
MRLLLVTLTTLVTTVVLTLTVSIARLLGVPQGPRSIYAWSLRSWARSVNWAAGVRVRIHGRELLETGKGAVFISNHVSWFDIFALAAEVPWSSFIAKAELRRIPLWGFAAESAGVVFLDRDNRKQAFERYKVAAAEVQRGRTIIVCPEGTRGHDYHLRPFKKGPFVLAIASQSLIVPTIVYGTREIMPKGSLRIRSGTVDLHFLTPVPTEGLTYDDRSELMSVVWNRMADAMRALYGVGTAERPIAPEGVRTE